MSLARPYSSAPALKHRLLHGDGAPDARSQTDCPCRLSTVVIADTIFTATAAILQPVTGYLLARSIGWDLSEGWIALSLLLYVVTGLFWLPVVWIQIRLRDLARAAAAAGKALPPAYFSLYRLWFAFGFPAFSAVLGIFWLMLTKPTITLF